MTLRQLPAALAPFRVRSFRFQWPGDLATSWAFEMETLILGWYVLVETGSVWKMRWDQPIERPAVVRGL